MRLAISSHHPYSTAAASFIPHLIVPRVADSALDVATSTQVQRRSHLALEAFVDGGEEPSVR